MKFRTMFSPIQVGPMTVKNRFVVPPMGNNFANTDGTWSDQSVAYYAERAKGQFGLITIEATVVHNNAKGGRKCGERRRTDRGSFCHPFCIWKGHTGGGADRDSI